TACWLPGCRPSMIVPSHPRHPPVPETAMHRHLAALLIVATLPALGRTAEPGSVGASGKLADELAKLDARVIELGTVRERPLASVRARDAGAALREATLADLRAWEQVKDRASWERFRDARLQALRAALGSYPPVPASVKMLVTGSHEGDGYRVDNVAFASRP